MLLIFSSLLQAAIPAFEQVSAGHLWTAQTMARDMAPQGISHDWSASATLREAQPEGLGHLWVERAKSRSDNA